MHESDYPKMTTTQQEILALVCTYGAVHRNALAECFKTSYAITSELNSLILRGAVGVRYDDRDLFVLGPGADVWIRKVNDRTWVTVAILKRLGFVPSIVDEE